MLVTHFKKSFLKNVRMCHGMVNLTIELAELIRKQMNTFRVFFFTVGGDSSDGCMQTFLEGVPQIHPSGK